MIISDPIPWPLVPPGAVVLLRDGVPRLVLINTNAGLGWRTVVIEGLVDHHYARPGDMVRLVTLGDHDAVATLAAAGLNPEEIS